MIRDLGPVAKALRIAAAFAIALLAVAGCGKKKKSSPAAAAPSPLLGAWASGCTVDSSTKPPTYAKDIATYTDTTVTSVANTYSDAACTSATGLSTTFVATFVLGAAVAGIDGALDIDVTPTALSGTPLDDATAAGLNQSAFCGDTDWAKGTTKDLSTCKDPKGVALNAPTFDIVKITGSTYVTGLSTADLDGTTAAKRPATLDPKSTHTKQ